MRFFLLLLLLVGTLEARGRCFWEVDGGTVYWKGCVDEGEGDYEAGYRVGMHYLVNATRIGVEYTHWKGDFRYETVDATVRMCLDEEAFYALVGVRYIDMKERGELTGAGVRLGAGGAYSTGRCTSLTAEVAGLLGLGEQRGAGSATGCFAEIEGRVGGRYEVCGKRYLLIAEAGYEILYYLGPLRRRLSSGDVIAYNVGLHGAYAKLGLRF